MSQDVGNKPEISIIVPVYNTRKYLEKCVSSLRAQTFTDFEILLVDDGSTDGAGELCDSFAAEDNRIQVFHKPNGGSSSARNLGLLKAKGKYVGFIDSDDYVDADMYERLYEALKKNHARIAQVGRDEIDEEGNILPDICIPPEEPEVISSRLFMKELLMHRGDCSFCTKLLDRNLFFSEEITRRDDNSFPEGVLNEDFHLLIQLLGKVDNVVSLPGHVYHVFYRLGSNSRKVEADNFSRVYADNVDNADLATELVNDKYPELRKIVFRFGIFQRLDYLLHIPMAQMTRDNRQYRLIVSYMRKNWLKAMFNPILTGKNKLYHTLFAIAPKGIRQVHAWKKLPR